MTNDLEKLREEIAEIVHDAICKGGMYMDGAQEAADEILALPQIADLLRMKAIQVVPSFPKPPHQSAE